MVSIGAKLLIYQLSTLTDLHQITEVREGRFMRILTENFIIYQLYNLRNVLTLSVFYISFIRWGYTRGQIR